MTKEKNQKDNAPGGVFLAAATNVANTQFAENVAHNAEVVQEMFELFMTHEVANDLELRQRCHLAMAELRQAVPFIEDLYDLNYPQNV